MKSGHKSSRKSSRRVLFLFNGFTKIFALPQGVLCKSGLTAKAIGYDSDVSREKVPRLSLERGRKKNPSFFFFFFPDQFNLFRTINRLVTGQNQTSWRAAGSARGREAACGELVPGFALAPGLSSAPQLSTVLPTAAQPGLYEGLAFNPSVSRDDAALPLPAPNLPTATLRCWEEEEGGGRWPRAPSSSTSNAPAPPTRLGRC